MFYYTNFIHYWEIVIICGALISVTWLGKLNNNLKRQIYKIQDYIIQWINMKSTNIVYLHESKLVLWKTETFMPAELNESVVSSAIESLLLSNILKNSSFILWRIWIKEFMKYLTYPWGDFLGFFLSKNAMFK